MSSDRYQTRSRPELDFGAVVAISVPSFKKRRSTESYAIEERGAVAAKSIRVSSVEGLASRLPRGPGGAVALFGDRDDLGAEDGSVYEGPGRREIDGEV